ncbi:hypothetical protein SMSP2_00581 [Limihaloglobus sulfuriphilus]|uniref:Probable pectate lyase C n=1 Tax=Limihaloglobus sulfuriphilus TaxID=1851148 RepID=A0A1Q2MCH2_9BACT|nr:right-handed parallel beta-helix repeat-containing protein [Limihaloglobus sulfuriphilus]AQQ70238.1 hypothetical protein SMSP2_00581 [Limihaloglobus sulfuriphilus]
MKFVKICAKTALFAFILAILEAGFCLDANAEYKDLWIYTYDDDFSTHKARTDSYDHSVFWPENAFPPAEPYLVYSSRYGIPPSGPPGLLFNGFKGKPAHLNYCFPVISAQQMMPLKGKLEFDLKLARETEIISAEEGGSFSYSISPDGKYWSLPVPLKSGHQEIPLGSEQGTCYVSLSGQKAVIDNLEVILKSYEPEPDVLLVPSEYPTIQDAVNASANGDTVEVEPGTYTGEGNTNIELLGKAITVRSAKGPLRTIIECGGISINAETFNSRGFYLHQAERRDTVIEGFTIQNGIIHGSEIPADNMRWNLDPSHPIGAGINCEFASPTIRNCRIMNCGTELGGGIGCVGANPVIENCNIQGCRAGGYGPCESGGRGGAIGMIRHSNASIFNCEIKYNMGYYNSGGGGIYTRRSSARINRCDISGNGAGGSIAGGGIYCGPGSRMAVENSLIWNNQANCGAGIYTERDSYENPAVTDCPECCHTYLLVKNCTIAHNQLLYPMPIYPGSGIHANGTDIYVRNCIVWHNKPTQIIIYKAPCKCPVTFSNVQGGYPNSLMYLPEDPDSANYDLTEYIGGAADIENINICDAAGNIDEKPLFANPELPEPDYHLKSLTGRYVESPVLEPDAMTKPGYWVKDDVHSPSIDAGDTDDPFRREPRPNGYRVNMGAYGNTRQASKSVLWHILNPEYNEIPEDRNPDVNHDGRVDFKDVAEIGKHWLLGQEASE